MSTDAWEADLVRHVNLPEYKAVKPRVLAKKLGIADDDALSFKRLIKKMVKRGVLAYGSNHLVGPATKGPKALVTGVFRRVAAGHGFVRPRNTPSSAGRDHDILIPAEDAGDASSGDLVAVKLRKPPAGQPQKLRGQIVEVVERQQSRFVGTYYEHAGSAFVRVDGTVFNAPVWVGDPGAKSAQPDDKVVFEMVRFPSQVHGGEGVIVEVLGARGAVGVDTLSIIREFGLPGDFPESVLDDARAQAERFGEQLPPGRDDLTDSIIVTIDPIDARDFDDAISLERTERGHWLLGVHIADVAHFVPPGSALDSEAYARATSVYLPDRVIPMLPELISNGLASLQPDRVRYTKTAFLEFTAEGIHVHTDLRNSAIRSRHRFTYEDVDAYLADAEAWRSKLSPEVHALVSRMHELAMILRARRLKRGALELTMQEVKIDLDKEGRVAGAHRVENTVSHQIIEEFMLAANEAVADALAQAEVPFLRRVHGAPSPLKLKALNEFVGELGLTTDNLESRFAMQDLLRQVHGKPEEHAVNYALLRSLQRAVYSPEEEGHYALASECYCHFTSPIRRYPDLTVHRLVDALVMKRKAKRDFAELVIVGEHCSDRERRAEAAERELIKVKMLDYMSSRVGEEMDAVITGVEDFGLFAQGVKLPAEGLIRVSTLSDDFYTFDKATHSLTGRRSGNSFRLGDPIRVCVVRVDVDRRALDFRLVEADRQQLREAHAGTRPTRSAGSGAKAGKHGHAESRGGHESRSRQRTQPKPQPRKAGKKRRR